MDRLTREMIEMLREDGPQIITDGSWQALCDMALRADSSGEAVREACARVAERAAFYWNKPGDISTETERMICKAREMEAMAIRNEIRGLAIPLPTLPAAEGWKPIESAPKDGAYVRVGWEGKDGESVAAWAWSANARKEAWCGVTHGILLPYEPAPTHWQPLPAPPAAGDV